MHIYLENNRAKFHPDPISNNGAVGFLEEVAPNKKMKPKNKMSNNVRSIPGPKSVHLSFHMLYISHSAFVTCKVML